MSSIHACREVTSLTRGARARAAFRQAHDVVQRGTDSGGECNLALAVRRAPCAVRGRALRATKSVAEKYASTVASVLR